MDTQISKLRKLNGIAGLLHLASLVGIIALSNDASMPVRATYLTDAPTLNSFSAPIHLFNLNISWMIGAFLALSAFFHFLIISPKFFPRYSAGLGARHNYFRWVEYSFSSSLMIVVILQLNGVSDYIALSGMFGVNASMILFGWLQEKYVKPGSGDMLPFYFGCIAGSVPWIMIAINIFSPNGPAESVTPGFVYGIVISLFILFNSFAFVQWKQYQAKGKWANYLYGERVYIILSLVAKSLLAWQIFSGSLIS
jgi:hypothetical protein